MEPPLLRGARRVGDAGGSRARPRRAAGPARRAGRGVCISLRHASRLHRSQRARSAGGRISHGLHLPARCGDGRRRRARAPQNQDRERRRALDVPFAVRWRARRLAGGRRDALALAGVARQRRAGAGSVTPWKRITRNTATLIALRVASPALSMLVVLAVSRVLGAEGLGRYTLAF